MGSRARDLAWFHTGGTKYMPAREYLGLTDRQEKRVQEFIDSEFSRVVEEETDWTETVTLNIL